MDYFLLLQRFQVKALSGITIVDDGEHKKISYWNNTKHLPHIMSEKIFELLLHLYI